MLCDCGAFDCKTCGPAQGYGNTCEGCGFKDYDCECEEIKSALDAEHVKERGAYRLDLRDRIDRKDFEGAGAAVVGAFDRGLIDSAEAAADHEQIWTAHQDQLRALNN